MTSWTPDLKIFTLPPNADIDESNPRTEVTDLVDYSIDISVGAPDYITPPYPMQATVTLLFDENRIPEIYIGSYMEIRRFEPVISDYVVIKGGYVINRTSAYRAYGLSGFVLEWTFTLASAISILQNMTWYNPEDFTGTTTECLERIETFYAKLLWSQVNSNLDWTEIGGETWADFDTPRLNSLPALQIENESTQQHLESGFRNVWDDLVTLVYGVYGILYETSIGNLGMQFVGTGYSGPAFTLPADIISPNISANDSVDKLRNLITISEFDGTSSTYYDDDSITLYQERSGSLNTYLTSTLDAADVGQQILNSLSFPTLACEKITIDLTNPNMSDIARGYLYSGGINSRWKVQAPLPMNGEQLYLIIGANFQITKDAYLIDLTLTPFVSITNNKIWSRIGYNYTWTSYGVAFPTQEWQDL